MTIAAVMGLLAGVYCFTPAKEIVNTLIVITAGRLGFDNYGLASHLDIPLDEAMAQRARAGRCKEYTVEDANYDVLTYFFDGAKEDKPDKVVTAGLKAIRKGGFQNQKKMTLVIFCNLATKEKSHKAVYPYGLFLESATLRDRSTPIGDLAKGPLIQSPMNWDHRINEWVYTTNSASKAGPDITENPAYTPSTNALAEGWFMYLRNLTNKAEVCAEFGVSRYYVREAGTYSEVYPVDDAPRAQTGTVRVWYDGERVIKTGCYMDNK